MKKYMLLSALLLGSILPALKAYSQSDSNEQREEIIIRKKGDFPENMTIQLHGSQVTINGKKPEDIQGNIEVIRKKSSGNGDEAYGFSQSAHPFSGRSPGFSFSPGPGPAGGNKALLGVLTIPDESSDGAQVEEVERGTPADSAGLQKGDIITKVNDAAVRSSEDLSEAIGRYTPGDKVTITYKRDHDLHTADVILGRNDNRGTHFALNTPWNYFRGQPGRPGMPPNFLKQFRQYHPFLSAPPANGKPRLGMTIEERDDGKGVTVEQVEPGSAAARSGFREGDVLSVFAGQKITGVDDVVNALDNHRDDASVQATVIRDGKERSLTVQIPKAHRQADL